jgi:hypothetical protein
MPADFAATSLTMLPNKVVEDVFSKPYVLASGNFHNGSVDKASQTLHYWMDLARHLGVVSLIV